MHKKETMDAIGKEEYKQIFTLAIQLEQRMLQIFMVSLVISVSLLSAISGVALTEKLVIENYSIGAYLALAPNLITYSLIYSHFSASNRLS